MRLVKRVPEHFVEVTVDGYKSAAFYMNKQFREIRRHSANPMTNCWLCDKPFKNGDSVTLAIVRNGPNISLCRACTSNTLDQQKG